MHPTLKSGDRLVVLPYRNRRIGRGDVIVFVPPRGKHRVVHRVIYVSSRGIRTKGDNNYVDPWLLGVDCIIGRAVCIQKGNGRRRVLGGLRGQLFVEALRAIRLAGSGISFLLLPAYRWLVRKRVFSRLIENPIKTRVVSFSRPEGTEFQLLFGRHVIGWLRPGGK